MSASAPVGPEAFRALGRRAVVARRVARPTLVLGSTQDLSVVDRRAVADRGVEILRRRSGGGAVLVRPGSALWLDAWVPRDDPLWEDDVRRSAQWVGRWWATALELDAAAVHSGPPVDAGWSRLLCFAGVGPGEVVVGQRKLVGVAQWRGREGALAQSLAYLAVDWDEVAGLLRLGRDHDAVVAVLARRTASLADLGMGDAETMIRRLAAALPEPLSWDWLDPIV